MVMIPSSPLFYPKNHGRGSMKKRALFVEDERWGVAPYFHELEKNGFECVLARNGDEAMGYFKTQKFDLISIDIMFPPGEAFGKNIKPIRSGVKLLEMIRSGRIKNCAPDIKAIILTAVMDHEIEAQIKKLNVSAYLKKPIDFEKVIEIFRNLN